MGRSVCAVVLLGVSLMSGARPVSSWLGALPAGCARFDEPGRAATRLRARAACAAAGRMAAGGALGGDVRGISCAGISCAAGGAHGHLRRSRRGRARAGTRLDAKSAADELSEVSGDVDEPHEGAGARADRTQERRRDVVTVSPEFTALCQAQFEVLASVLGASRCDLYFRREDPRTGNLEFVPAAVYPEKQRVWVVGEGPTGLPSTGAIQLAGFIPATSLLPEYPFVKTQREGGPSNAVEIGDGGLSVPIEYNSVVLGMLAVWREGNQEWTEAERAQVQAISTSLALAVVLDQKHQWQEAVQAESLRKMLSETLHQVVDRGCVFMRARVCACARCVFVGVRRCRPSLLRTLPVTFGTGRR